MAAAAAVAVQVVELLAELQAGENLDRQWQDPDEPMLAVPVAGVLAVADRKANAAVLDWLVRDRAVDLRRTRC